LSSFPPSLKQSLMTKGFLNPSRVLKEIAQHSSSQYNTMLHQVLYWITDDSGIRIQDQSHSM
jgi:hypothetical protein